VPNFRQGAVSGHRLRVTAGGGDEADAVHIVVFHEGDHVLAGQAAAEAQTRAVEVPHIVAATAVVAQIPQGVAQVEIENGEVGILAARARAWYIEPLHGIAVAGERAEVAVEKFADAKRLLAVE